MLRVARAVAWALVGLSVLSIVVLAGQQAVMIAQPENYGIETRWFGLAAFFILSSLLPGGAAYAALKGKYGPSILLGGMGFAWLSFIVLVLLAGGGI